MGCEYSREFTRILRFFEENAIFVVASEGFEGVKFMAQLHYASSKSRPKRIHHAQMTPKTKSAKTRQACSRFLGVNSREFIQISPLCTPSFALTRGVPPLMHPCMHPGHRQQWSGVMLHSHICFLRHRNRRSRV